MQLFPTSAAHICQIDSTQLPIQIEVISYFPIYYFEKLKHDAKHLKNFPLFIFHIQSIWNLKLVWILMAFV